MRPILWVCVSNSQFSRENPPHPVWRQPNVDHVGSWRATAPGRTVAACVQRALLDSHPVSAKRPEDGG